MQGSHARLIHPSLINLRCCLTSSLVPLRSNDAYDATTGVDGDKPESVVNLTGNRGGVLALANAFLAAGGLLLWRAVSAAVRAWQCLLPCDTFTHAR